MDDVLQYDDIPSDSICPECGCTDFEVHTTIEGADADGRRGIKVTWLTCVKCGYELSNCPF